MKKLKLAQCLTVRQLRLGTSRSPFSIYLLLPNSSTNTNQRWEPRDCPWAWEEKRELKSQKEIEGREDLRETEGTRQEQPAEPVHPGCAAGFYPSLSGTVKEASQGGIWRIFYWILTHDLSSEQARVLAG